jgi:tetratricopeptide (TPR) repeat protein
VKTKIKIYGIIFSAILITSCAVAGVSKVPAKSDCDSLETLKLYSLFSEYHKNKDYQSALPYGWQVLECDKEKFAKWIYYKMEDCLWNIHDSTTAEISEQFFVEDSILSFYDMAITYYPSDKGYFQVRKAFVSETWLNLDPAICIAEYEKAFEYNPNIDKYYLNRLGELYIKNQSDDNDYYNKAIKLYSDWAIEEPENPIPITVLNEIAQDPTILLDASYKAWQLDSENLEKAWSYASTCIRVQNYERAIAPLEFLTTKSPETINYWNQLATCYNKVGQANNAEAAYQKLIQLDPGNKDFYFNLGLIYKEQGKLSKARQYFETANDKAGGWGMAIFSIGLLYEQSARDCKFDFETKLVYLLAQDTYRRAVSIDPSLSQARDRIGALSTSIPSQEDWFFHKKKSGDVIPITGDCFTWIGKSVTVP